MGFKELRRGTISNEAVATYHGWPTVANMGGDKLVAVASGNRQGHICPYGRVYLYESDDKGMTWQGPRIMSQGPLDDRDAGIMITDNGTWILNYFTSICFRIMKDTPEDWLKIAENINLNTLAQEHGFFIRRSTDQGKTWSEKIRVPVNNVHGPVTLSDGTLLWQGKGFKNFLGSSSHANDIVTYISNDDGVTWQEINRITNNTFPGINTNNMHELTSVQAADGTVISHIRVHDEPCGTWQTVSEDMGRTWSKPEYITPGFPAHLLRLADSTLLTVYGYRDTISGIRARTSSDNGNTWSSEIILDDGSPTPDLGYPSTVQFADGTLFTLWYQENPETKIASLKFLHWELSVDRS